MTALRAASKIAKETPHEQSTADFIRSALTGHSEHVSPHVAARLEQAIECLKDYVNLRRPKT